MNPHRLAQRAAQRGDLESIQRLVTLENVNALGELDGRTVLQIACRKGYTHITEALIGMGADVNVRSHNGCTALSEATAREHFACVQQLLSAGADPTIASNDGSIPLHVACPSYACAELLVTAYPAGVHVINHSGNIPLHFFVLISNVACCQLLLNAGSRVDVVNYAGATPLYFALRHGKKGIAMLLIEHGAQLDNVPMNAFTEETLAWATSFVERRKACRSSSYAMLELARRRSSVIGGNRRDALGLIARALWATRQEEEWNF